MLILFIGAALDEMLFSSRHSQTLCRNTNVSLCFHYEAHETVNYVYEERT